MDGARTLLRAHHSAPFGSGMQRRGGGGGGAGKGGGGNAAAARQWLLSLFDGALADRGPPVRRGLGIGKGGGRQSFGAPRGGEWSCQCGFGTNRPHRTACYVCGRPRDVAEMGQVAQPQGTGNRSGPWGKGPRGEEACRSGGGSRNAGGPIGADGNRPLLGWGDRSPQGGTAGARLGKGGTFVPMGEGKGPKAGAHTGHATGPLGEHNDLGTEGGPKGREGKNGKPTSPGNNGEGQRLWTKPQTVLDDEGYRLVQPRRVRTTKGNPKGDDGGGNTASGGETVGGGTTVEARRRWSDDSDDDDWAMDEDEDDDGDAGDWAEQEDADTTPDPRQLRTTYEQYARTVRDMERKGAYGPAVDTLRQARDAAEESWRRAKAPAPLPRRLEWAEAKLRKAQAALDRVKLELDRFDQDADRRRTEIVARIHEAEGWVDWRQQQLDGIHDEAAERAPGRRAGGLHDGRATEVREKLRGHFLPEMQAILEEVQEGSAVHERLTLLVAGLADAEAKLGDQRDGAAPEHYDLHDNDSQYDEWQGEQQSTIGDGGAGTRDGDPGGGCGNLRTTAEWRPEGPGRWSRTDMARKGAMQAQPCDASTAGGHHTTSPHHPRQDAVGNVPGKEDPRGGDPARTGCSTSPTGKGGTGPGGGDDGDGERAGKHRRRGTDAETRAEERAAADARRAEELHRQLQIASAAQEQSYREGSGGFGSETALSVAAQKFVLEVQRAQAQANELGIQPCAEDGRSLLELSPAELRQWTGQHFDGDGMRD